MIVFDIDNTISPTRPPADWDVTHETRKAGMFYLKIPTYVLDFLRSRQDIALLSTWGDTAQYVAKNFEFDAKILVMNSSQRGIQGKFDLLADLDGVTVWVDDHITPKMKKVLEEKGILVIKPVNGVISNAQMKRLIKHVQ